MLKPLVSRRVQGIKVPNMQASKVADEGQSLVAEEEAQKEVFPFWRLCLLALPQLGVQLMWMFLGANATPFMKHLGAPDYLATLNMVAGPLVGFFAGPLVGAWSDHSTCSWGRRIPIIMFGLVSTLVAGVLWAGSERLLPAHPLWLSAPMYWVLDLTVNILQTPFRALVADMASDEQQAPLQVVFVVVAAVGNFGAYSLLSVYDNALDHMLELMLMVLGINVICIAIQTAAAKDKPAQVSKGGGSCLGPLTESLGSVRSMPPAFGLLLGIHCMAFFGIQTWNAFSQQWFTFSVYDGDEQAANGTPEKEAFIDGKNAYASGGQMRSVLQLGVSLLIMGLLAMPSIRPGFVYGPCLYIGAAASLLAAFAVGHSGTFAMTCLVLSVVAETGTGSVPYGLVASWSQQAEAAGNPTSTAMQMALLNCCITVGQQVTVLALAGLELPVTHLSLASSLLVILGATGVMYALAGTGALFLKVRANQNDEDETSDDSEDSSALPPSLGA
jgi:hypothetical protein